MPAARRPAARLVAPLLVCALLGALPLAVMWFQGGGPFDLGYPVHFWGVVATSVAAACGAVWLGTVGYRRRDPRIALAAAGFTLMAVLLALHGLATPTILVGSSDVLMVAGALTLPAGALVLVATALPALREPRRMPMVVGLTAAATVLLVGGGIAGIVAPQIVPPLPEPRTPEAITLLVVAVCLLGALAVRSAATYLLTRRRRDLATTGGLVLLVAATFGPYLYGWYDLGFWLSHAMELAGILIIVVATALDTRVASSSRALVGDLRARELVAHEEDYLGCRVRSLLVRLAEKDPYTEGHTRRVATLGVEVGEAMGLPAHELRRLAIAGLLHDIGKLRVPDAILKKPDRLTDEEFGVIRMHPVWGAQLLDGLGGFHPAIRAMVLGHHERVDGTGYPDRMRGADLSLGTRILAVCDVYDALVTPRVYRGAWSHEDAMALLHLESGTHFDPGCVAALETVLARGDVEHPGGATAEESRAA